MTPHRGIGRLPILTFHDIGGEPSVISVSPSLFRHGLRVLSEARFTVASLADVPGWLANGAGFPERTTILTFDDGHHGVYKHAFPELAERNLTATVFLSVGQRPRSRNQRLPSIGGRTMMSWEEVGEMARHGIEFGAHTCSHPDLTVLNPEEILDEVKTSKEIIEDQLGIPVTTFAYPFGRWDATSRDIVSNLFESACTDRLGFVQAGGSCHTLPRIDSYYLRRRRLLNLVPTALLPWYVWARSVPRALKRPFGTSLGPMK